jgi:hypothetical protein
MTMIAVGATATPTGAALLKPAANPKNFFGLGAEHGNVSASQRGADLDRQAATGVGAMRENIHWDLIERSAGQYDFSTLDAMVGDMARRGLTMMPDLLYAPNFYTAKPAGTTKSTQYPPKDPATMAAFATKLVKRYGPRGTFWCKPRGLLGAVSGVKCDRPYTPITTWQVWNEPNYPAWWGGTPNAAEYTQLLTAVSKAIHKADRKARVMAGGVTNKAVSEGYIDQLYGSGAAKYFDILALHPYGSTVSAEVDYVRQLRNAMVAHGDGKKPLALTEYGWSDGGAASPQTTTTLCQAALDYAVTQKYRALRQQLGIDSIYAFYWNDQPANPKSAWPYFAGLTKTNGTAKPALAAFTAAVKDQPPPEGLSLEAACPPDRQSTT